VLKDAIVTLDPIYASSNDQAGRVQTSKLFPQLKISLEEKTDPDEILAKFLGRSKPRVQLPVVDEPDKSATDGEEEEEEEEEDMDDNTGGDVSDAPAPSLTTGDEGDSSGAEDKSSEGGDSDDKAKGDESSAEEEEEKPAE